MSESRPKALIGPGSDSGALSGQWLPLREAAARSGVSAAVLTRWCRAGRVSSALDEGKGKRRRLVDFDEVLLARDAYAGPLASVVGERPAPDVMPLEADAQVDPGRLVALACERLVTARKRAVRAESEVEQLRNRVAELESWLARHQAFESVEQLQLERLLAVTAAQRQERRAFFPSFRFVLVLFYIVAISAFAWTLVQGRL